MDPEKLGISFDSAASHTSASSVSAEESKKDSIPLLEKNPILPGNEEEVYLDSHRILKGKKGDPNIKPSHREWFINQAILLASLKDAKADVQSRLQLVMLHGYSKVSTVTEKQAEELGIQTSPLLHQDFRYHHNTSNDMLTQVQKAFAKFLGMKTSEVHVIDSPLIKEVFAREIPQRGVNLDIYSDGSFEALIEQLLTHAKENIFPEQFVLIDFTNIMLLHHIPIKDVRSIVQRFETILMTKWVQFFKDNPSVNQKKIATDLIAKLHLIAYTSCQKEHILLTPEFLATFHTQFNESSDFAFCYDFTNRHSKFEEMINNVMSRMGYRLCPAQAKKAWLKVKGLKEIFEDSSLPMATMAKDISRVPNIFPNCQAFLDEKAVADFTNLGKESDADPYLKVLPEATMKLIVGLSKYHGKLGGIDEIFKNKGIEMLLQVSYFRMINAMKEACFRKNNLIAFLNQIELIHQEIQCILAVVQPYDKDVFAESAIVKLTSGPKPVIPTDLYSPKVHLKASAMHSLSSVIAAVEIQKGSNDLNVGVLKDSYYYDADDSLKLARAHKLSPLNEDNVKIKGIKDAFETPPGIPLDLFIAEFHHNILFNRQVYTPVDVASQVNAMIEEGLVADKFTVVIDTTIDLELSDDVRNFLNDDKIKKQIHLGKLNVVLLRSAQKFDMLGIDNYYGGITATINDNKSFGAFDVRMNAPDDQLKGLSYQGLTHLQKYGGNSLDKYREEIMKNTRKLYEMLPQEAIYTPGTKNPMQISRINDNRLFFIDVKFPNCPKTLMAFRDAMLRFSKGKGLPFTIRLSFGFANINLTVIDEKKFRLCPGLDSGRTLNCLSALFQAVQSKLAESMEQISQMSPEEADAFLSKKIEEMELP